jgi:toxin ParE1/3/4
MNYRVIISKQAEEDLRSIFEHIAWELQSVSTAANQLARLEKEICDLDHMPERFRVYDVEPWRTRNLRIMPVDNYLVFYIPDRNAHTVSIIRVMYGGRDIASQLDNIIQ